MKEREFNESKEQEKKVSEIDKLREEVKSLKEHLLPDKLAKAVDSSYGRIRLYLQILAIMIAILLAGAVGFGFIGTQNILSIYREATEVEKLAGRVSEDQKEVESYLKSAKKMEGEIVQAISDFNDIFKKTISDMQSQWKRQASDLKEDVNSIRDSLDSISEIFNRVAVKKSDDLNAREVQLLVLLAQQISPDSPVFSFNYGYSALGFGRYDEALEQFNAVLKSKDVSPDLIGKTKLLIKECEKRKASPPEVKHRDPTGMSIGGFAIMHLHVNTIDALWKNGYLTYEQAEEIFKKSKVKK